MAESLQEGARRLAKPWLDKGYRAAGLHVYRAADSSELYAKFRLEHPDGDKAPEGRKIIRPFHANGNGSCVMGEPKFQRGAKPLYRLTLLASKPGQPVIFVEGEKDCDALVKLGAVSTTTGSASSDDTADLLPLAGRTCWLWADNDDEGRAYMGRIAKRLQELGATIEAIDVEKLGLPPKGGAADWVQTRQDATYADLEALPRLVPQPHPAIAVAADLEGGDFLIRNLSDIEAKPVRWLWPGRIARGKVSMIAGHPGLGKSQITAALAAVVTTGGSWPVDRTPCERGRVILLNAEDDAADTIRPRMEAAGADVTRCEVLDSVVTGFAADGEPVTRGFSLREDLRRLGKLLETRTDVALIVIDPISAYMAGVDSHVNSDVRAVLAPLGDLAGRHGVAVVCVSHLNKGNGKGTPGEAMMRVTGSLAFVAAARAMFLVTRDQEDPNRRLFVTGKNNIGKDGTGLAFSVESYTLSSGIETSRVMWEPTPITITADEAMAPAVEDEERTMTDDAIDLLNDALSVGRVQARDIKRRAGEAGISDKALRIARNKLGIVVSRTGFGAEIQSFWALPGSAVLPSEPISALQISGARMEVEGTNGGADDPGEPF